MTPSQLRALVGVVLVPNLPNKSAHTIRFKVTGFGSSDVRVLNTRTMVRSTMALTDLEHALDTGVLIVEV